MRKPRTLLTLTILLISMGCHEDQANDARDFGIDAAGTEGQTSGDTSTAIDAIESQDTTWVDDLTMDAFASDVTQPSPVYLKDDVLRVNHLQALGTHNSYHVAPELRFLPWAYTHLPLDEQLGVQGVRQFELDVYQNQESNFDVYHILFADDGTTCASLRECLSIMKLWSDQNIGHHPILVLIEPKGYVDPPDMVISKLNSVVLDTWGRHRVLTPDDVQRDQLNVRDGIAEHGWPTLGETRNRLIVILHTAGTLRDANLQTLSTGEASALFSDAYGDVNAPYAAYHSMNNPIGAHDAIQAVVEANHLVRTRSDSDGEETQSLDYERANAALSSGAHFISTDFPYEPIQGNYGFVIPSGTPSRCNPIQAPVGCEPSDIEDISN